MQVGPHFIGDGAQRVADHLDRDGVELFRHESLSGGSTEMTSSPVSATVRSSPGKSTVAEPYSLTRTGPVNSVPGGNSSRE